MDSAANAIPLASQPAESAEIKGKPATSRVAGPALALAQREWVRFLRQRNRVIGAILTPVLFWLLLGGGMGSSFTGPTGEPYLEYFFPGMLLMIVLFTAIFATITLIEDRREGFMQGVLAAPVPRWGVVLGKTLGGASLASAQAILLLLVAPLAGIELTFTGFIIAAGFCVGLSFALVALGMMLAWPMTSTQGYHVAMNLLLMPLWFLSGAVFPLNSVGFAPIRWIAQANPLSYGLSGLRSGLGGDAVAPLWVCGLVTLVTAVGLFAAACVVANRPVRADVES
ncbi:MAG: ABC transporter permease [Planctomycetota bacterium]